MHARVSAFDWSRTPLGPIEVWPQSLKSLVKTLLASQYPMVMTWGPHFVQFYNDAYSNLIGDKHPAALSEDIRITLAEAWDTLGPMIENVMRSGVANWTPSLLLVLERAGYREESYFSVSHAPAEDDNGNVVGMLGVCSEVTQQILGERRLRLLRDLASRAGVLRSLKTASQDVMAAIEGHPLDVPFALLYLRDATGTTLELCGVSGLDKNFTAFPQQFDLGGTVDSWQFAQAASGETVVIDDIAGRLQLPGGPWGEPVGSALVMPIASSGQTASLGVLVAGVSPNRALDENYLSFYELLASQVSVAIRNSQSYEEERRRAEALSQLDRAKTEFFSNVSHEFRTPLTLMLGPLEEAMKADLPPAQQEQLSVVQRNSLRLLHLVNTLLDFSRIEAGRAQATYRPTDLAVLTTELASTFRSAVEQAGLSLKVDCPPLLEPVYVDREMWEKIVLNLLSNAYKFTLQGDIAVSLRAAGESVELQVCDTGSGIPPEELPHLFERFHRVRGVRSRTHEGTGIGLSLVQELVKMHGGEVRVQSTVGQGTTFLVSIPTGTAHLPADHISEQESGATTPRGVEEALSWLPLTAAESASANEIVPSFSTHILLVDDNADMRDYVKRLLQERYTVEVVSNGREALQVLRERVPDLVLTDVMMPEVDGFELLRVLRAEVRTKEVPVILLSARAGEESRVEGLQHGADDYLVKPFSARELLARVEANLNGSKLRRESAHRQVEDILESITDAFYAVDHQWRFTYVNQQCEKYFDRSREELLGKTIWDEFPATKNSVLEEQYRRVARERTTAHFETFSPILQRWVEIHAYPRAEGIAVYFQDITSRKQAETEREHLLLKAQEANRVKDDFLATISHELRTPLTAVLGWSGMLMGQKTVAEEVRSGLETIHRNAQAQAKIIEDILDVSRSISGKLALHVGSVQLNAVLQASVDAVRLAAEAKNLQLEMTLQPQTAKMTGDTNRLQQVFLNLLSNAVKFTPAGGSIEVLCTYNDCEAHVEVRDSGQGIEPEFLPYVFDRFRQADMTSTRRHGGLGLGLAIVRQIVELHGGTVGAQSAGAGQGSTFRVSLPLNIT
jgi:PAS domain S-box-containing protein